MKTKKLSVVVGCSSCSALIIGTGIGVAQALGGEETPVLTDTEEKEHQHVFKPQREPIRETVIEPERELISIPPQQPELTSEEFSTDFVPKKAKNGYVLGAPKASTYKGTNRGYSFYWGKKENKRTSGDVNEWKNWAKAFYKRKDDDKTIPKEKADKIIRKLDNYTVQIASTCGPFGTGWILDYVIPEKGYYPTKWFIATNIHVAEHVVFANNQKYGQETGKNSWCYNYDREAMYIEREITWEEQEISEFKYREYWSYLNHFNDWNYKDSLENDKKRNTEVNKENKKISFHVWKPQFLFSGADLFEDETYKEIYGDYVKDFAVLEINFRNEYEAIWATNGFHNKFHVEKTKESFDVLAEELSKRKTKEQIRNDKTNFFTLGYTAHSRDLTRSVSNYSVGSEQAAALTKASRTVEKDGEELYGHLDMYSTEEERARLLWKGRPHKEVGYYYVLDNHLGGGASGSLVVDEEGKMLGLYSASDGMRGYVEPLRSEGIGDDKYRFPKYDLILGAEGQKTSYKQQLDKYFPTQNTFLRQKYNWAKPTTQKAS